MLTENCHTDNYLLKLVLTVITCCIQAIRKG